MTAMTAKMKQAACVLVGALGLMMASITPAAAQGVESIDPDSAFGTIDADLSGEADSAVSDVADSAQGAADEVTAEANDPFAEAMVTYNDTPNEGADTDINAADPMAGEGAAGMDATVAASDPATYGEDDLIGAAEGVFGKGAEGLARLIQDLLKEQGEPNGYIVGREAGGAFIVGARYGSGTLHHKIEGTRKVYWTGPSIGLDAGANAGNTFVLVYNLFDTEDLFARFPAGEGQAYLIGGLHASYMRKGDKVLIPIRVGAGLRLGVNAGYMKFSKKQRWLPF